MVEMAEDLLDSQSGETSFLRQPGHEANGLTRGFASPLHSGFALSAGDDSVVTIHIGLPGNSWMPYGQKYD
jgi:hypothetical protein